MKLLGLVLILSFLTMQSFAQTKTGGGGHGLPDITKPIDPETVPLRNREQLILAFAEIDKSSIELSQKLMLKTKKCYDRELSLVNLFDIYQKFSAEGEKTPQQCADEFECVFDKDTKAIMGKLAKHTYLNQYLRHRLKLNVLEIVRVEKFLKEIGEEK